MTGRSESRRKLPRSMRIVVLTALFCLPVFGFRSTGEALHAPSTFTSAGGWSIEEYTFPSGSAGPSIVARDRQGGMWIALARAGKLARFRGADLKEFTLPPNSFPVGLAIDARNHIWFSDIRRNLIGKLDPASGGITEYPVPTPDSWPFSVVETADGLIWFTERMGNKIGRLDPTTGQIVEFAVPTARGQPAGMAATPQGQIFFTENSANRIGHLDPRTGVIREYAIPTPASAGSFYGPAGITSDAEGNVWFAQLDGRLGRIRAGRTDIEEITLPWSATRPAGIVIDRWNLAWFTELDGNSISSYDPALRTFRRYPIPTGRADPRPLGPPEVTARGQLPSPGARAKTSRPFGIAVDDEGSIWFSEQYAHKAGVLRPARIEVFEPQGVVSRPQVSIRIQFRFPEAPKRTQYWLDDELVTGNAVLDLTGVSPGCHRLTVRTTIGDGETVEATSTFVLAPSLELLRQALSGVLARDVPRGPTNAKLRDLVTAAESRLSQGDTPGMRVALREIARLLRQAEAISTRRSVRALLEHLRDYDLFAEREFLVNASGALPTSTPTHLVIEVGDRVRWSGHQTGGAYSITGPSESATSPPLAPGDAWTFTFYHEGEYRYSVPGRPAAGTVEVRTRTTAIEEIAMAGPNRVPGVLAMDSAGAVWFTAGGGGFSRLADVPLGNRVGRLQPDGRIVEYQTSQPGSAPTSLKVAPDGSVWFTQRAANRLGQLDPSTGRLEEHEIPGPFLGATGIAIAPDGTVWFTGKAASVIGQFNPADRTIRQFPTPDPRSEPSTITIDSAGYVWFDERGADKLVRLDPWSGTMKEFVVPTRGSRVIGLLPDPRGYLWFLELGGHKIGRLEVASGHVVEFTIPTALATPFKATLDGFGRLWFTEVFGNRIGVLDRGRFFEFAVPTAESMPGGITIDAEGNVWFSEQAGNKLGVIRAGARALAPGEAGPACLP